MQSGLAGIVYPNAAQMSDFIFPMLSSLKHGVNCLADVHLYQNVQLGICGHSFTFNKNKSVILALDGQLENSASLSQELKNGGIFCDFQSPAEIVLQAYELWGIQCLDKINGDFALSIFDQKKECLYLARDRIGKKPLYWYEEKNFFIFSTEIKAMLASGVIPQTPASDALATYLYFGYCPQDITPIKQINKLLPGHYLKLKLKLGKTIQPYWSYSQFFINPVEVSEENVLEQLNTLLEESILQRMPTDEKKGCIVTGGLGSASIACYLKKLSPHAPFDTFFSGFKGQNDEDLMAARQVSTDIDMPLQEELVTPETLFSDLPSIIWHLDEPIGDPNICSVWQLANLAQNQISTIYSGMGSDELFAGHSRYSSAERDISLLNQYTNRAKPIALKLFHVFSWLFPFHSSFSILRQLKKNPWQFEFLFQNALFNETELKNAAPQLYPYFDTDIFLHKFHKLPEIQSRIASFLYFDIKTRLPDCFIMQYERLLRAKGLIWQTPFLSRSLFEFAAGLLNFDILHEHETGSILKNLMKPVLSKKVLDRPKKTRRSFLNNWLKEKNVWKTFSLLKKGQLIETGMISEKWLTELLQHPVNHPKAFRQLWAILILEIWIRLYISRSPFSSPPTLSTEEILQ